MSYIFQGRSLAEQLTRAQRVFGALAIAGFVAIALLCALSANSTLPELDRSRLTAKFETAAYEAMLNDENALHGYLLTHNASDLERVNRAEVALARSNEQVVANAGSVPDFVAPMMRTQAAEERWHERWASSMKETSSNGGAPSFPSELDLFDSYRSEHAAFAAAIDRRAEIWTRREWRTMLGLAGLELLGLIFALFLVVHTLRALRDSIVGPLAAMVRDIGRVSDGEAEIVPTIEKRNGPRELHELGQALNGMVHRLAAAREVAESRGELLREHSTRLRQILDASREFAESLNLAYVVGAVRASTAAVGGYDRVIVWLMDDERARLVDSESAGKGTPPPASALEMGQGLAGRAAKSGRITVESPDGQVRFSDASNRRVRATAVPLIVGARVVGVLEARYPEPQVATSQAAEVLEMFATHAATAIEAARLHELTEERSQVDPLTQLFNRRRLEQDLGVECKRCARYARPLAFVMLDIDHFKSFNDRHGHPQGDVTLKKLADVVASAVRTTDTAYRYGGEEFCILLRETAGQDAMVFAERLRRRIEKRFASDSPEKLTASFGVAEFSADLPTAREMIEAADVAMYQSKHAGRNRVILSSFPPPFSAATGETALPAAPIVTRVAS